MLLDRVLATLAALSVMAFFFIMVWFVPHLDLIIVIALVMILMVYDFWRDLGPGRASED